MEQLPATSRRVAWRWLVAALCAAWIVTILPALPLPKCRQIPRLFGSFPDWRDRFLWAGGHIGAGLGALASLAWGYATGAFRDAHLGSRSLSLSFRAWSGDIMHWGVQWGMLLAASAPPWVLWTLGRLISLVTRRSGESQRSFDPSLVLAAGWSLGLSGAFATVVTWQLLHPIPSWLMVPPMRGATIDTRAPLPEWCAYSFHARASECETALNDARMSRGYSIAGFAYDGARCVPLAEHDEPSLRTSTVARVTDTLERALAGRAVVRRDHRMGEEQVDVAVLDDPPDGHVLLALDVGEGPEDARTAARLAAAGVPDYWRVELYPNRDPVTMEMLRMWKDPDVASRRYASVSAYSHNPDLLLRPTALAEVRIPIDEVLPFACERAPSQHAGEERPTASVSPPAGATSCHAPVFMLDANAPPPTLVFDAVGADGVASRLRFRAISVAPGDGFDPVTSGLVIGIHGPFLNEEVVDAVLPAGGAWRRADGAHPSWAYRDPAASVAGIVDVTVRSTDDQRFVWEIRGERGRYRVPMEDIQNWGSIGVHLGSARGGNRETCGAVFFRTAGPGAGCLSNPPDTLTCRGPDRAAGCSGDDPDSLVRCAIRQVVAAEEVFFALHDRHFSGSCEDLPDVELPKGLVCVLTGTATTFTVTMRHADATKSCTWTSNPSAGSPNPLCS